MAIDRLTTKWEDVGNGKCSMCSAERNLYRPLIALKIKACSTCAVKWANEVEDSEKYRDYKMRCRLGGYERHRLFKQF